MGSSHHHHHHSSGLVPRGSHMASMTGGQQMGRGSENLYFQGSMPIGELAIGAVLGVGAQAIYDRFRKARDISFVHRLCATIISIEPFLVQIDKRSKVEGSPLREVNERLTCFLELAYVLVEAYPKLRRRQVLRKYRYIKAIEKIELALRRIIVVDFQVDQWDDIKEIKAKISEVISACSKIRT